MRLLIGLFFIFNVGILACDFEVTFQEDDFGHVLRGEFQGRRFEIRDHDGILSLTAAYYQAIDSVALDADKKQNMISMSEKEKDFFLKCLDLYNAYIIRTTEFIEQMNIDEDGQALDPQIAALATSWQDEQRRLNELKSYIDSRSPLQFSKQEFASQVGGFIQQASALRVYEDLAKTSNLGIIERRELCDIQKSNPIGYPFCFREFDSLELSVDSRFMCNAYKFKISRLSKTQKYETKKTNKSDGVSQ